MSASLPTTDLMTIEQLQDVRDALECLIDLDIPTDDERHVLQDMDLRVAGLIAERS